MIAVYQSIEKRAKDAKDRITKPNQNNLVFSPSNMLHHQCIAGGTTILDYAECNLEDKCAPFVFLNL